MTIPESLIEKLPPHLQKIARSIPEADMNTLQSILDQLNREELKIAEAVEKIAAELESVRIKNNIDTLQNE